MTEAEMMAWIDGASLEELLRKWRFEPTGSPWTSGEAGAYFLDAMGKKRDELGAAAWTAASTAVGWQR